MTDRKTQREVDKHTRPAGTASDANVLVVPPPDPKAASDG